jgi:hypothetical protein
MGKTIGTLAVFIVVGLLPKVPWWAKLLIQLIVGAVIYFAMAETPFPLPNPDTNPIGAELYGGNIAKAWGMEDAPKVAFLSIGFLGTVLGVLTTGIVTVIGALVGTKKEG